MRSEGIINPANADLPELAFLGAGPATSNLGVSALLATMVAGVARRLDLRQISVFDYGLRRSDSIDLDGQGAIKIEFFGLRRGARIHRPENLTNLRLASRCGRLGSRLNCGVRALRSATAVLDVSGGDSFTDMYPDTRIETVAGGKELVLRLGRPLILLPQTYGPFHQSRNRAAAIVRAATACWARDERSFEILKGLLGDHFQPERHRCGVDMAFGLAVLVPSPATLGDFGCWLDAHSNRIGLNVSGLMYNSPAKTREKYGFRADYHEVIDQFVEWVLNHTEQSICLIPHVMAPPPAEESDSLACERVLQRFSSHGNRVVMSPVTLNQSEVKWVISNMGWFCGTRMHATIAGLSTCTPTATVSYSDKAVGVFESCGQGSEVFDPRKLNTDEVVSSMIASYQRRAELRASLGHHIPEVKAKAEWQMDEIARTVLECAEQRVRTGEAMV